MEKQIENVASWMTNRQRKCFHIVLSAIGALVQAHNVYSIIICSADNIYKLTVFSFAIAWYQQISSSSSHNVSLDSFNLDHLITQQLFEWPYSNLTAESRYLYDE